MENSLCYTEVLKRVIPTGFIGAVFEYQPPKREFRDTLSLYFDGKAVFTRYCYGEAAGAVCTLIANGVNEKGEFLWGYDKCAYSRKQEAPTAITRCEDEKTIFCGSEYPWKNVKILKSNSMHGYGKLNILFKKAVAAIKKDKNR